MKTAPPFLLALLLNPTASAATALTPGALVITEVMSQPANTPAGKGEWFEVQNTTSGTLDLKGLQVRGSQGKGFTVTQTLRVAPGAFVVFAADEHTSNIDRDWTYSRDELQLNNKAETITLSRNGVMIDAVAYDSKAGFPLTYGVAMQLSSGALDADRNDDADAWCRPLSAYDGTNLGTPGAANDACPGELADLVPGELIVSELMISPTAATRGEWLEVQNLSTGRLDLQGLEVATETELVVIADSIVLNPGEVAVLAQYKDTNGRIPTVHATYGDALTLDDTAGLVRLTFEGVELDVVSWEAGVDPVFVGASLQVDGELAARGRSADADAWCIGTIEYNNRGDLGSPGEANGACGIDGDGDGVPLELDCDDSEAATHPWADEVCDGEDNDCNGSVDDDALDPMPFWADTDGDGFGAAGTAIKACEAPEGYVRRSGDCDDSVASTHPGADEVCDAIDNDCDSSVDEQAVDARTFYVDSDKDGYGGAMGSLLACEAPEGYAEVSGDCNDARSDAHPGATETCDGRDNDCDGATDEDAADALQFYVDADGDGFGSSEAVFACEAPADAVDIGGDCDDTRAGVAPGAKEVCDGIDNDCDGETDEDARTTWYADADGDQYGDPNVTRDACSQPVGFVAIARDCDDSDPAVSPAGVETCDRIDNDCNGVIDECGGNTFYRDADGDGFGDPSDEQTGCFAPEGYVADSSDCDDTSAAIFPGAPETCDDIDNDCDAEVDEGISTRWYLDADGDGFGRKRTSIVDCAQPEGYVADNSDCDDDEGLAWPGASEVCDGIDNDCDGQKDEGVLNLYYHDADGDGFGVRERTKEACELPEGYATVAGDCLDGKATAFPGNTEVCDDIDNDCDGETDEGLLTTFYKDGDKDGFGNPGQPEEACELPKGHVTNADDCNDWDAESYPGAEETCDGGDNDCDGQVDEEGVATFYFDADGDGYGTNEVTVETCPAPEGYVRAGGDCDDTDADISPGAEEECDGIDNDCTGVADDGLTKEWYLDADGDGYGDPASALTECRKEQPAGYVANANDCDDSDAATHPWATEQCDGIDNDCNDEIDDGTGVMAYVDADGDGYGDASTGVETCTLAEGMVAIAGDCDDSDAKAYPEARETCDEVDNDCDGEIDEEVQLTFYRDADGDGAGTEALSIDACEAPVGYSALSTDCDDSDPTRAPTIAEECDGLDNDCDGVIDDGVQIEFYADADGDGWGDDLATVMACEITAGLAEDAGDCDDRNADIHPTHAEVCDEVDNDCDEAIDEEVQTAFYADADGDGFGDPARVEMACEAPDGFTDNADDCEDSDPALGSSIVFYLDMDGDGHGIPDVTTTGCTAPPGYAELDDDCDDEDPNNFPGNTEACDGLDNTCDGAVDEGAQAYFYADVDEDGFGDALTFVLTCEAPAGFVTDDTDCDDTMPTVNPGMEELCDNLDNNCDDTVDEGVTDTYWADRDNDGFGDPDLFVDACDADVCEYGCSFVDNDDDCDDTRPSVNPAMDEVCDGLDNDCDTEIDEELRGVFYADVDGDGYGDASAATEVCAGDGSTVSDAGDCDDADDTVHPGAAEACDGLDNDCDGAVDDGGVCEVEVEEPVEELVICSGEDGEHRILEGGLLSEIGVMDPDALGAPAVATYDGNRGWTAKIDGAEWIWDEAVESEPGIEQTHTIARPFTVPAGEITSATLEIAADDRYTVAMGDTIIEEDETGGSFRASRLIDLTGFVTTGDNRLDIEVTNDAHPGSSGYSNPAGLAYCVTITFGGEIDEETGAVREEIYWRDADGDFFGDPEEMLVVEVPVDLAAPPAAPEGYVANDMDCDDDDAMVHPFADEVCNALDDDCDGDIDEGLEGTYYADVDGDGHGDPGAPIVACEAPLGFVEEDDDCDDTQPAVYPGAEEACDLLDNDCDDEVDEEVQATFYLDADQDGFGDADHALMACEATGDYATQDATDCDDGSAGVNPLASEVCDNRDNDCDGVVDMAECIVEEPEEEEPQEDEPTAPTARALWVRTDGARHSDPTGTDKFGSAEAAALLESYGMEWDSVRLKDVDFDGLLLEKYDLVILYGKGQDGPLTGEEAAALEAWLEQGGALMYHTFHPTAQSCQMVDSLPESIGVGCVPGNTHITGPGRVVAEHPVTEGVERITALGGERWETFGKAEVLMANPDGWPLVTASRVGAGRVVAIADEWPLYNAGTNPKHDISALDNEQFIDNAFCWLSGECGADEETEGQPEPVVIEETLSFCSATDGTVRVLDGSPGPSVMDLEELGAPAVGVSFIHPAWVADIPGAEWVWETPLPTDPRNNQRAVFARPFAIDEEMTVQAATLWIAADNWYTASINGEVVSDSQTGASFKGAEEWDVTEAIAAGDNRLDVLVVNRGGSANPKANPAGLLFCLDVEVTYEQGAEVEEPTETWYLDADGDGYGDAGTAVEATVAPTGYVLDGTDCNDREASVNPAGLETCDELDNDCDGEVDEGLSLTWYRDVDGDGFGTLARSAESCAPFGDFTSVDPRDCDDSDKSSHPYATEVCDGADNDCDGDTDEELMQVFFADMDGDGYGDDSAPVEACEQPSATAERGGDCDDDASDVHPGATDPCDNLDNDCDGKVDEDPEFLYYADRDGDGWGDPVDVKAACEAPFAYVADDSDCDDSDAGTFPGAAEECDGIDNDCDGAVEADEACETKGSFTMCSAADGQHRVLADDKLPWDVTDLEELGEPAVAVSFIHRAWTAKVEGATWIWEEGLPSDPRHTTTATIARPFDLGERTVVHAATLEIAADNNWEVILNGESLAASPQGANFKRATTLDVTDALVTGWNRLDLAITNAGGSSNPSANPAGVLYCLTVDYTCEEGDCPVLTQALEDESDAGIIEEKDWGRHGRD